MPASLVTSLRPQSGSCRSGTARTPETSSQFYVFTFGFNIRIILPSANQWDGGLIFNKAIGSSMKKIMTLFARAFRNPLWLSMLVLVIVTNDMHGFALAGKLEDWMQQSNGFPRK